MLNTVPMAAFSGFSADAFAWFEGLEADNSKRYFAAHRDAYETAVRGALGAMLDELALALGGEVKLFRQHRDVRFSHDKSPYKTRTYGIVTALSDARAPLYAELSSEGLFIGTGYYVLASDQLERFRESVADDGAGPELESAIETARAAGVETWGEALKTAPRGYPREHPRLALLRHKSLIAGQRLGRGHDAIDREPALGHARAVWDACGPIVAWLDRHVGASEQPVERRR
jgi:uncharacterized protein (TIGR02453 family)